MTSRSFLLAAAATAALVTYYSVPASATPSALTVGVTLTENPNSGTTGGPVITPGTITGSVTPPVASGAAFTDTLASWSQNVAVTVNSTGSVVTGFFTLAPNASPKGPSINENQIGTTAGLYTPTPTEEFSTAQFGWIGTETDLVSGTFVFTDAGGYQQTVIEGGVFEAKYGGPSIGCSSSGGLGFGNNTDCFLWNGSSAQNGTGTFVKTLTFGDNEVVQVTFGNAEDWNIAPTLTVTETVLPHATDPVPEPASFALLGFGLLGTLVAARRRRA